jgi:hypothetical protein
MESSGAFVLTFSEQGRRLAQATSEQDRAQRKRQAWVDILAQPGLPGSTLPPAEIIVRELRGEI